MHIGVYMAPRPVAERRMNLRRSKAYEYGGKPVHRFDISIPKEAIEKLGWEGGASLDWEVRGDAFILRKAKRKD